MKNTVMLSIRGMQRYPEQDPEVIELVTEGTLETYKDGWKLKYEESDLTGLAGVTTTFFVEPSVVTLQRTGPRVANKLVVELTCNDLVTSCHNGILDLFIQLAHCVVTDGTGLLDFSHGNDKLGTQLQSGNAEILTTTLLRSG